jgi:hypothetical protein
VVAPVLRVVAHPATPQQAVRAFAQIIHPVRLAVGADTVGDTVRAPRRQRMRARAQRLLQVTVREDEPGRVSRSGTTQRLFSTSSGSVRSTHIAGSSIQRKAGTPKGAPTMRRSVRMSVRLSEACGATTLTMPARSSRSMRK